MSILGHEVLRVEDSRFLHGQGRYVENLPLDGALSAVFVRSPFAHARVVGIDASAAEALPNVHVLTGADVNLPPYGPPPLPGLEARMVRPTIAKDVVRFVGDIVAVVLAETRAEAVDAAELVMVDYDPLPVVTTVEEAVKDEVLLFPEVGTNVAGHGGSPDRDENLFDGCEVVVSGTFRSPRMASCSLEPRSVAAGVGEDGRLTAWIPTQTPQMDHFVITAMLGIDPPDFHLISPDVGGGFGPKTLSVEELLVVWLARRLSRPVRWTETRSENMVAMAHGRSMRLDFTLGGGRDGKLQAYRLEILADAGAYPILGAFLPNLTALMSSGVYAIPKIEAGSRSVVTNTTPISSFRGAGRPEATQTIEHAMDLYAAEIGMDPVEIRRRNFIPKDAFPFTTASGAPYDSGDYAGALDLLLRSAGYEELRAEQQRRREAGGPVQMGIGIASYVEISNPVAETEFGEVEVTPDGGAIVRTGSFSHGQGHETTFAMIASDRLGIPVEKITVIKGDTDEVPKGTGTYGSKSTQLGGSAARVAADGVVVQAKKLAAEYLEAAEADIVLDQARGAFHPAGVPGRSLSWAELASRAADDGRLGELKVADEFTSPPSFPFGAHLAVVEVDTETAQVELKRLVAVDDAGTLINPLIARGQVHGGVATGVSQALYEHVVFDEDGNPMTNTFLGYAFPSAADLPSWEVIEMETPTPLNALGAKGIGESGTMGSTPAVQNAVIDALSQLGVRTVELPCNGENVWRALKEVQA